MKLDILCIVAHPDDVELCCAGTIIKHIKKGQKAGIIDLTEGELGSRGSAALRYEEAAGAARVMGLSVRENAQFADGFFKNDEAHQRKLIQYIRKYQPEIVIAGALADRHPDHGRAAQLAKDACFLSGLRKIETALDGVPQQAWRPKRVLHMIQDRQLEPSFIVDISDEFDAKLEAILCYKSQFNNADNSVDPKTYISSPAFMDQLRYRDGLMGKRIDRKYAEGFVSEYTIGLNDLDSLLLPEIA